MLDYMTMDAVREIVPDDHIHQSNAEKAAKEVLGRNEGIGVVLDLGCGNGDSFDFFRDLSQEIEWVGVDIAHSPEVDARTRSDCEFHTFDGVNIPFDNNCFDLVFCKQSFEHVRHPEALLKEVWRVLRPGGFLVGSTSHLEPFHSFSFWNYTPCGFCQIVADSGMKPVELRPGIDAITLILRRILGRPKFFARWWKKESPLNRILNIMGRVLRKPRRSINVRKLLFCGQFSFVACKPSELCGN